MKNLISEIIKIELVKELLSEGRVETTKEKYPGHDDLVDYFVRNDPSGNNKYLDWMVKRYLKDEYAYKREIVEYVTIFHKNINKFTKRDINQYKTWEEFEAVVKPVIEEFERKEADKKAEEGAKKLFENENWLLVRPLNHQSSCKYGAGTKWCTTSKDSDRHFNRYTKEDLLVYLIYKPTNDKFALYYQIKNDSLQIYNPPDTDIMDEEVAGYVKNLDDFFKKIKSGGMSGLLNTKELPFVRSAAWFYENLGDLDDNDYGITSQSLRDKIMSLILEQITVLDDEYLLSEFLDSLGLKIEVTDVQKTINKYGKKNSFTIKTKDGDYVYSSNDLNKFDWKNFIKTYIRSNINDFNALFKVFYALPKSENVKIYVDFNKPMFGLLSKDIFLDIKNYQTKAVESGDYQNIISPKEINLIKKAFNNEKNVIVYEIADKKYKIIDTIKFPKQTEYIMKKCYDEEYNSGDFDQCLFHNKFKSKIMNINGKKQNYRNFMLVNKDSELFDNDIEFFELYLKRKNLI